MSPKSPQDANEPPSHLKDLYAKALIDPPHSEAERLARFRLARTHRIGPVNFCHLIQRFGTGLKALDALPHISKRAGGHSLVAASQASIEGEIERGTAFGASWLVLGDEAYPKALAACAAPPMVLWLKGWPELCQRSCVAIVGARNASAAGQTIAAQLSRDLSAYGFVITSGLARGIDAKAHEHGLSQGTIAVLGGGLDDIYPPENRALYQAIAEQGLIMSESMMGYRAQARDFPRRNRIISGLSIATVVVEAEMKSGSLITAKTALEQNRDLFAVPGSPLDPRCRGSNDLLRQGASLCEEATDIIHYYQGLGTYTPLSLGESQVPLREEAFRQSAVAPQLELSDIDQIRSRIKGLISHSPTQIDHIIQSLKVPAPLVMAAISELDITGQIVMTEFGGYVLN